MLRNVFLAKIPFYFFTVVLAFTLVIIYFISPLSKAAATTTMVETTQNAGCLSSMNILRLKDFELVKPILLADIDHESSDLEETKASLLDIIHQQEQYGNISTASIYLRKFSDGSWLVINGEEEYQPGSLMKVPILITYLKQLETSPGLLDKKILFTGHAPQMPLQNFVEDTLIPGNKYTIRNLLERMIINSDNDAVTLLNADLNVATLKKLFSDLNLPEPEAGDKQYPVRVKDYAKFFRILFNGSYLNHNLSEYGLNLLTEAKFKKGLSSAIPEGVKVAHKFGESGITGGEVQLHEGGVFYLNNNPYLLVVMTKGKDFAKMNQCLSTISDYVYKKFAGVTVNL